MDRRRLRLVRLNDGETLHTAYSRRHWPALFNGSGRGTARFSPLVIQGVVIPTMYAAATQTVALLEASFHDVHETGTRIISEPLQLATRGLVAITTPSSLPLVDLTDDGLNRMGIDRTELVATTPQHYPCTREWAVALHGRRIGSVLPVGLLWQSRVAELAGGDSLLFGDLLPRVSRVCVIFGDRVATAPSYWDPGDPHYQDLSGGDGRILAEQIAEQLGAVIVPS